MRSLNLAQGVQNDESRTLLQSAGDVGYNVGAFATGSALSVLTSVGNLGVHVGNVFGEDREYFDTGEALGSLYGQVGADPERAKDFYDKHSGAVELGGLVAGSIIPGGLAVNAFRGMQLTGKVSAGARAATGLRNPSLHTFELNKITQQIRANRFAVQRLDTQKLYSRGFVQQAKEAAVFELATVAVLNRNPVFSNEEMGYLETFWENKGDLVFGVLLGGGIGGALSAIGTRGALRDSYAFADQRINKYATTFTDSGIQMEFAGNTLAGKLDSWGQAFFNSKAIDPRNVGPDSFTGPIIQREGAMDATKNLMQSKKIEMIDTLNQAVAKNQSGEKTNYGEFIVNNLIAKVDEVYLQEGADSAKELLKQTMQNLSGITKFGDVNTRAIQNRFVNKHIKIIPDADDGIAEVLRKELPDGVYGGSDEMAFLEQKYLNGLTDEAAEAAFIRAASLSDASDLRRRFHNYQSLIRRGEKVKNPYMATLNKEFGSLMEKFDKKFAKNKKFLDDPANAVIEPERYARLEEENLTKMDPENLMKFAFNLLEGPKTVQAATKTAQRLAKAFRSSNALRTRFGETKQYMNPHTGEVFDTVSAPTLRDFGTVNDKQIGTKGRISAGQVEIDLKQKPINIAEDIAPDTIQMSGHYYAAVKKPLEYMEARGIKPKKGEDTVTVDWDDLPAMYALTKTKTPFTVSKPNRNNVNEAFSFTMKDNRGIQEAKEFLRNTKAEMANLLRRGDKKYANTNKNLMDDEALAKFEKDDFVEPLSEQEIARIIDTDVKALTQDLLKTAPRKERSKNALFYSEAFDPANPAHVEITYPRDYVQNMLKEGVTDVSVQNMYYQQNVNMRAKGVMKNLLGPTGTKGIDLIPNQVDSGNAFTYRVNQGDSTVGFVTSSLPDVDSTSAYTQAIGKSFEHGQNMLHEGITTSMQVSVRNLKNAGVSALAEVSTFLQSVSRNRKYYPKASVAKLKTNFVQTVVKAQGAGDELAEALNDPAIVDLVSRITNADMIERSIKGRLEKALNDIESGKGIGDLEDLARADEQLLRNQLITFDSPAARQYLEERFKNQNRFSQASNEVAQATGLRSTFDPDLFYPGKLNVERYSHVAFIEDRSKDALWGARRKGVVTAPSADDLRTKIAQVEETFGDQVAIYTNRDAKEYFRATQEYKADLAMGENFVDSAMTNKGILWDAMPEAAENVIDDDIVGLRNMATEALRDTYKGYYAQEIKTIRDVDRTTTLSDSALDSAKRATEKSVYKENINQMLNISNRDKYEWYYSIQEKADEIISKGYYGVRGLVHAGFNGKDQKRREEAFAAIKDTAERFGMPLVYKDIGNYIESNTFAPKKVMQSFVAASQGILSNLTLRMDHAQAIVNTMSMPILLNPAVKEAINAYRPDVKNIRQLKKITTTVDDAGNQVPADLRFAHQAVKTFFRDKKRVQELVDMGYVSTLTRDVRNAIDSATIDDSLLQKIWGVKKAEDWYNSSASKAVQKRMDGMKTAFNHISGITANDWSEQFVKFVSAETGFQVAKALGLNAAQSKTLAWNMMTRVNGNYTASQRPVLFQGWMGQSVGLFQTYSFNMMQTAYRNIRDKRWSSFNSMVAMQSSIFGAQSLPGFQAMNSFIAERTFGEKDFYSFADEMGEERDMFAPLVYGFASAATIPIMGEGIDFFNRGDLTPRTPIMIPTSLADVPLLSFANKTISSITETASKIGNGAPVGDSLMAGLAKNGLNRPLAGAAQLMQGYSTTNQGSLMFDYPAMDFWTISAKLMGTKTMNEAIATNAFYRKQEERVNRQARTSEVGRAFKESIRSEGGRITPEISKNFMQKYLDSGGRADTFNQWVSNTYNSATTSQINEVRETLGNPDGRYLYNMIDPVPDYQNRLNF